jgi:putative hydrolase of the HAD superfamily
MQISASIKNIIFDLGGVILNIDYDLTKQAFEKFGVKDFDKIYSQSAQQKLFDDFETGKISASFFRRELKKIIPQKISDEEFDQAWNAMLLNLPAERIKLLEKLKMKYRLFLLSNTNEIHFKAFSNYLQKTFGFKSMKHIFEKEYPSYKIGMRKPDKKVFELVLRENNLCPKETLFIDDSIQHIEGAKKMGIKTLFIEKGFNICSLSITDK